MPNKNTGTQISKRRWKPLILVTTAVIVLLAVWGTIRLGPFYRQNLQVHVDNAGDMEFQSVEAEVDGSRYSLGSLSPGKSSRTIVNVVNPSAVKITITDLLGNTQSYTGGDFRSGQVGDLTFVLTHEKLIEVTQRVYPR